MPILGALRRLTSFALLESRDAIAYLFFMLWSSNPTETVTAPCGRVVGRLEESATVAAFRGVPYAECRRFEAPRPVTSPASAVLNASQHLEWNLQPFVPLVVRSPSFLLSLVRYAATAPLNRGLQGEETTFQKLNVFVRKAHRSGNLSESAPKPVMVVIHGGAYCMAAADALVQDGAKLAAALDVVVVCVNYRLGPLGFASAAASSPDEEPIPANLGYQDMIAALRWVKDNIASFGGDPNRITINGESAGGHACMMLLANNAANIDGPTRGALFHAVFAQSAPNGRTATQAKNWETTKRLAKDCGWEEGGRVSLVQFLRTVDAALLVKKSVKYTFGANVLVDGLVFSPTLDGKWVQFGVFEGLVANASQIRHIPLLSMYCRNEYTLFRDMIFTRKRFPGPHGDADALRSCVDRYAAAHELDETWRKTALQLYSAHGPSHDNPPSAEAASAGANLEVAKYLGTFGNTFPSATAFVGDTSLSFPSQFAAVEFALQGGRSYLIRFDVRGNDLLKLSAGHYVDVPYVFGIADRNRALCGVPPASGVTEKLHEILAVFLSSSGAGAQLPLPTVLPPACEALHTKDESNRSQMYALGAPAVTQRQQLIIHDPRGASRRAITSVDTNSLEPLFVLHAECFAKRAQQQASGSSSIGTKSRL